MVGTKDDRKLKLKAMETFGMLMFLLDMLRTHADKVTGSAELLESGRLLLAYVQTSKAAPEVLPEVTAQARPLGKPQLKRYFNRS